jgi:hypothetical protein
VQRTLVARKLLRPLRRGVGKRGDMADNVNHPKHYNSHPSGVECITVVEHMNFNIGNAIKYLWRTDHKNGLEDLKKARWYIDREIQRVEGTTPKKGSVNAA